MMKIPFFQHDLGQEELDAVAKVLATPILTTGETVHEFEKRFSSYLGVKHTLGLVHCTGAIHLSLLALGIGHGDEVITTPMTFIATSTAIMESGARPVFVDVEPETGNINASKIDAAVTDKTRAIVPVHLYGQLCDMKAIRNISDRHNLIIVEDAAHCIEGEREGVRAGQLSDTACFSFFATKNMACGEGGALVCNDTQLFERLKLLSLHGMTKSSYDRYKEGYQHWDMVEMGWKYNMSNLQAAMLLPQMDRLEDNWNKRQKLAAYYYERLSELDGVETPRVLPETKHCQHLFTIWVDPARRDNTIMALGERGVSAVVNYRAIHQLTYFREHFGYKRGDFPVAESIGDRTISLPFYPNMPFEHVDVVVDTLRAVLHS